MPPASSHVSNLLSLYLGEHDENGWLVTPYYSPRLALDICRYAASDVTNTFERLRTFVFKGMPVEDVSVVAYQDLQWGYEMWDHMKRPKVPA
jgi:hypothetical protein